MKKSRHFWSNIPGSKSIAIRALLMGYLSGKSFVIKNAPEGEDMERALECLQKFSADDEIQEYYTGNSGLLTRCTLAILCLLNKKSILKMGKQMRQRPMNKLVRALRMLGANIKEEGSRYVCQPAALKGVNITIPQNQTSQFITAILLIAPLIPGTTEVHIRDTKRSDIYVSTTLAMMKERGIRVVQKNSTIIVEGGQKYKKRNEILTPDPASMSPFLAMCALHRTKKMIKRVSPALPHEPTISWTRHHLDTQNAPDSSLAFATLAGAKKGKTTLQNIETWKYKESNRIETIKQGLEALGVNVSNQDNMIIIEGPIRNPEVCIKTENDHRIAMAFAVLKSKFPQISIENPGCVQKSYPKFWEHYREFVLSLNKNFILIGPPASGKTTLAKLAAKRWRYKYIDTDKLIAKKIGVSITKFIQKNGWKAFRKIEKEVIRKIPTAGCVIATGGGSILDPANRKRLQKNAYTIALLPPPSVLLERLPPTHPQFQNLQKIYKERKPLYKSSASIILEDRIHTSDPKKDIKKRIDNLEYKLFYTRSQNKA